MPDPTGRNVDVTSFIAEMVRDQESLYNAIVLRRKQRGTLLGWATMLWYSTSGVGRWSWSAVLMSATSWNKFISSGKLKNLLNLVLAR